MGSTSDAMINSKDSDPRLDMGYEKNGMISLKDIARITGYSVNTVSHALRDKKDIGQKTKDYIKSVVEQYGYVENSIAQSMRLGYTKTIAVILGDVSNPHFAILMKEIEVALKQKGYSVFLLNTNENEENEFLAIRTALNKKVDGIIICPAQQSPKNIEYLKKTGIAFVLIGRYFKNMETSYCICDDLKGGYLATKRLLELGHRKIVILTGPPYVSSAYERLEGYEKAMDEFGVAPDPGLIVNVPLTCAQPGNYDMLLEKDFSAIFAFSDIIAWDVWNYLERNGRHVPKDVSIIGFDHIQSRLSLPLPLASIRSYKGQMSLKATEILLNLIEHKSESEQIRIDTAIVENDSIRVLDK